MKLLDGLVCSIAGYFYESRCIVGRVQILETSKNISQYYTLNRPIRDTLLYSRGINQSTVNVHSWQTNWVQLSRAPSWGINVASPKFFSRKALIDHDNEFCDVLSISNILFDPERFRDRLKQSPVINSKLNNSFHFQRDGSRMIYQIQTLIVSCYTKSFPKNTQTKWK